MSKACYIVGAGDTGESPLILPENAFVIAADGGLKHLCEAGISADLIVGDFDSLCYIPKGENVIIHPAEKNETDTMIAVQEALNLNFDTIIIYGGLGGRFDHSLANMQILAYIANRGARGYLVGCGNVCTVIKNCGISFQNSFSGIISVFCMGDKAFGVDINGLKYPLNNHTLACDTPLGVSNEFIHGAEARISVEDGTLFLIWNSDYVELEKYTMF